MTRIITLLITSLILSQEPVGTVNVTYSDFRIGDSKEDILNILTRKKFRNYSIFYDNNDRYLGEIKLKSENSIKLTTLRYMEKEDIVLVFNNKDILFDIYSRIRPVDIRDYADYKSYYSDLYGMPATDKAAKRTILSWSLNKKRHTVYIIYDHADKSIILNFRDVNLNNKYIPK